MSFSCLFLLQFAIQSNRASGLNSDHQSRRYPCTDSSVLACSISLFCFHFPWNRHRLRRGRKRYGEAEVSAHNQKAFAEASPASSTVYIKSSSPGTRMSDWPSHVSATMTIPTCWSQKTPPMVWSPSAPNNPGKLLRQSCASWPKRHERPFGPRF
jgi:hypothetical protein